MNENTPSRNPVSRKNHFEEGPEWDGQVTVCFSHTHAGWVLLWIATTAHLQHITIHLTDAYNPFVNLFDWLAAVADNRLPAEVNIDEEGIAKTLYAASAGDGLIYFQILDRYHQDQVLWGCRCARRQLVAEFTAKFELFLQSYYQQEAWRFPPGPLGVDLTGLKEWLAKGEEPV